MDRRVEACVRDAMRNAMGYAGAPTDDAAELLQLVGRIEMLRRELRLPPATDSKERPQDRAQRLSRVLRGVAREALVGIWGFADALLDSGKPFAALEVGRVTVAATGRGGARNSQLAQRVADRFVARAEQHRDKIGLAGALRSLSRAVICGTSDEHQATSTKVVRKLTSGSPNLTNNTCERRAARQLVRWSAGAITGGQCERAALDNLRWALRTDVATPHQAVVDVHLDSCAATADWHVQRQTVEIKRTIERRHRYPHRWMGYLQTFECELGNVVKGRRCTVGASGQIACRSETTLQKVCRPSAGPIESSGLVDLIVRRDKTRQIKRQVHEGFWRFSLRGTATVRWADRQLVVPLDVTVRHDARWWNDRHGKRAKPDLDAVKVRQEAVGLAVNAVRKLTISVLASDIHAQTGAAAIARQHGDELTWADHTLRAVRIGHRPGNDSLDRLARLLGAAPGRMALEPGAPGTPPLLAVKAGAVLAELKGGRIALRVDGDKFAALPPRKDPYVEHLRSIVQNPIIMPARHDSHYDVFGALGPSPLDTRRITPRLMARARLFGWLSLGFGGDLEALGQGTRGWRVELAAGPTLSQSFGRIEVFGRLARQRLLPRADELGLPDGPIAYNTREIGLRASTGGLLGGVVGLWGELAYNTRSADPGALFGHPLAAGAIIDLRVAYLKAGASFWYGSDAPLTWMSGFGLRL